MQGLDDPCPCSSRAMKRLRSSSSSPLQESPPINKKIGVSIKSPSSSSSMKDPTINTVSPPPADNHHSDQLQSNPFVRRLIPTPAASPSLLQMSPSNSVPFTSSSSSSSSSSQNNETSNINNNNVNSLTSNSPVSCLNSKSSLPPFKRQRSNSVPHSQPAAHPNPDPQPPFEIPPPDPHPQPHPNQPLPPLPDDAPQPPSVWRICCIGATRIGTVTMMAIANFCPNVDITIVDEDLDIIHSAMQGEFPFYEPQLQQLNNHLTRLNPRRLRFTPDMEASILNAHMIFISIGMKLRKGKVEYNDWANVWKYLARMPNMREKIIVDLTTLPLDFETRFRFFMDQNLDTYRVVLNPSFISEGRAINHICNPSRVVIGTRDLAAAHALVNLYKQWVPLPPIYATPNLQSAILAKLGLYAIVASHVVSINILNKMAELHGADKNQVSLIISAYCRIEDHGVGFGGSDFEKCLNFLSDAAWSKGLFDESRYFKQLLKAMKRQGNV